MSDRLPYWNQEIAGSILAGILPWGKHPGTPGGDDVPEGITDLRKYLGKMNITPTDLKAYRDMSSHEIFEEVFAGVDFTTQDVDMETDEAPPPPPPVEEYFWAQTTPVYCAGSPCPSLEWAPSPTGLPTPVASPGQLHHLPLPVLTPTTPLTAMMPTPNKGDFIDLVTPDPPVDPGTPVYINLVTPDSPEHYPLTGSPIYPCDTPLLPVAGTNKRGHADIEQWGSCGYLPTSPYGNLVWPDDKSPTSGVSEGPPPKLARCNASHYSPM